MNADPVPAAEWINDDVWLRIARTAHIPPRWEFEAHTYSRASDNGQYVEQYPTGWATFRCSCGHKIVDRADEAVRQARDHIAVDHPDWEQIPDSGATPPVPEDTK